MSAETSKAQDVVTATLITNPNSGESASAGGVYWVTCIGPDGQVKWSDDFHNLVVNEGLQDMNNKYFRSTGYTTVLYLGLVSGATSPTYAAADTLASHAGWTESTAYTGSRKSATFGVTATSADPSVITNGASPSSFSMNATATIAGAFLCTSTDNSGVLFSAGSFTGGNKSVDSGDTLNVTYQFSLDAV